MYIGFEDRMASTRTAVDVVPLSMETKGEASSSNRRIGSGTDTFRLTRLVNKTGIGCLILTYEGTTSQRAAFAMPELFEGAALSYALKRLVESLPHRYKTPIHLLGEDVKFSVRIHPIVSHHLLHIWSGNPTSVPSDWSALSAPSKGRFHYFEIDCAHLAHGHLILEDTPRHPFIKLPTDRELVPWSVIAFKSKLSTRTALATGAVHASTNQPLFLMLSGPPLTCILGSIEELRSWNSSLGVPKYQTNKTACFMCGNVTTTLKSCNGCGQVRYCRKFCQQQHWLFHKSYCKGIVIRHQNPSKTLLQFQTIVEYLISTKAELEKNAQNMDVSALESELQACRTLIKGEGFYPEALEVIGILPFVT
jgi:hypothetical protein